MSEATVPEVEIDAKIYEAWVMIKEKGTLQLDWWFPEGLGEPMQSSMKLDVFIQQIGKELDAFIQQIDEKLPASLTGTATVTTSDVDLWITIGWKGRMVFHGWCQLEMIGLEIPDHQKELQKSFTLADLLEACTHEFGRDQQWFTLNNLSQIVAIALSDEVESVDDMF